FGRPRDGSGEAPAGDEPARADAPRVILTDWDPDGEIKTIAAMLFAYTDLSESALLARVEAMSLDERLEVIRPPGGGRPPRPPRPGRALERTSYRFDVLSDYGAFRDLQRHRMLTIEWQHLTPDHGYTMPAAVAAAGGDAAYHASMVRSSRLHDD